MTITSTGSGEILANGINGARGSAPGSVSIVGGAYVFDFVDGARDSATGTVAISGGAVIEIPTGALGDHNSLRGAFESDATGTVSVSGTDTRVTLAGPGAGRVEGSRFGTGTVEILGGAEVETYWVDTARDGTGSIVVSGTGTDGQPSLLLASGDFGQFVFDGAPDPLGGFVRVGRNEGSRASLTIENGGQMRVENASDGSRDGGAGVDILSFAGDPGAGIGPFAVTQGVSVGLGDGSGTDGSGGFDQWANFEGIEGTAFGDDLRGDDGPNSLFGRGGDDFQLQGLGGADLIDGGEGFDQAGYLDSPAPVAVDLTAGTGFGGDAEGDTLRSIEAVQGSAFADTLTGRAGESSVLRGNGGGDLLTGGGIDDIFEGDIGEMDGDRITDFGTDDILQVFDTAGGDLTLLQTDDGTDTVLTLSDPFGLTSVVSLDGLFEPFDVGDDGFGNARLTARRVPDGPEGNIRGTARDDAILLGQNANYLGGDGVDIYVLSFAARGDAVSVVNDNDGDLVQLVNGLEIASSAITANAIQIDLVGGAVVQILNAAGLSYEPGGNVSTGERGPVLDFAGFVEDVLGASVPASGVEVGGAVTIDSFF